MGEQTEGRLRRIMDWCVPRETVEWPRLTSGTLTLYPRRHQVGSRNSHLTARGRRPLLGWPADGRIYDCDGSCITTITEDDGASRIGAQVAAQRVLDAWVVLRGGEPLSDERNAQ